MNRDDIIRMAREAGGVEERQWIGLNLERFAALVAAAEREKVAKWMIQRSYATGHGKTIEDLLAELDWQIRESEREACAELAAWILKMPQNDVSAAIRARGLK